MNQLILFRFTFFLAFIFIFFDISNAYACNSRDAIGLDKTIKSTITTHCNPTAIGYQKYACNDKYLSYLNKYNQVVIGCDKPNKKNQYANDLLSFYRSVQFHCDAWELRKYIDQDRLENIIYLADVGVNCIFQKPSTSASQEELINTRKNYIDFLLNKIHLINDQIKSRGTKRRNLRVCKNSLLNCRGKLLSNWQNSFYSLPTVTSKKIKDIEASKDIISEDYINEWQTFYEIAKIHINGLKLPPPREQDKISDALSEISKELKK